MDRSLDDVARERLQSKRNGSDRFRRRVNRGGVRKHSHNDYNESSAWVHDKYDGDASNELFKRAVEQDRSSASDSKLPLGAARLKVENIHYELGHSDLLGLFERQGNVLKLELKYDRAGRSEGVAFVTYEREEDARRAIQEFDGANANGQPIHISLVAKSRPTETRSLFERIKISATSSSPDDDSHRRRPTSSGRRGARNSPELDPHRDPTRRPTPAGIDRYVPPERRRRLEIEREGGREGGRRTGDRNPRGDRNGRGRRNGQGSGSRPKKTVEELDAEMSNYFTAGENGEAGAEKSEAVAVAAADEDEDMVL